MLATVRGMASLSSSLLRDHSLPCGPYRWRHKAWRGARCWERQSWDLHPETTLELCSNQCSFAGCQARDPFLPHFLLPWGSEHKKKATPERVQEALPGAMCYFPSPLFFLIRWRAFAGFIPSSHDAPAFNSKSSTLSWASYFPIKPDSGQHKLLSAHLSSKAFHFLTACLAQFRQPATTEMEKEDH